MAAQALLTGDVAMGVAVAAGCKTAGNLVSTGRALRGGIVMPTLFPGWGDPVRQVRGDRSALVRCFLGQLAAFQEGVPASRASRRLMWTSGTGGRVNPAELSMVSEMIIVQLSRCNSELPRIHEPDADVDLDEFCLTNIRPGEGKTCGHGATLRLQEAWSELVACVLEGAAPCGDSEILTACQQSYENCFGVDCHETEIAALIHRTGVCLAIVAHFRSASGSGLHRLDGRICVRGGLAIGQVHSELLDLDLDLTSLEWFKSRLFRNAR